MTKPRPNEWAKGSPYYPEVASLLNTLRKHGLAVVHVHDGEAPVTPDAEHPASAILAVDESWVRVRTPDGRTLSLYILLGNSPGELVSDYHIHPDIDAAVNEHHDRWFGRRRWRTAR